MPQHETKGIEGSIQKGHSFIMCAPLIWMNKIILKSRGFLSSMDAIQYNKYGDPINGCRTHELEF
jgi:hypothetical protein